MATVINTTFKLKRGTAARWAELNPILAQGEPGFAYDVNLLKVGNGETPWNDLPYINDSETGVVSAPKVTDFPEVGDIDVIYKAYEEKTLYQWNEITSSYEELVSRLVNVNDLVQDEGSVLILNGGSATDNKTESNSLNVSLRLRRDNDYNYEKIKDTFIPANGEICLVDTARNGLRAVCGDGVSTFAQLKYIGESFKQAYYDNLTKKFYINKQLSIEVEKKENVIYLDIDTAQLYFWTGDSFKLIESNLPAASETILGVLKLYNNIGNNTDGTMTQQAITKELDELDKGLNELDKELDTKIELSLKEDEELVIFSL